MDAEKGIVSCSRCGAKNRVGPPRPNLRPVCGKCKALLPVGHRLDRPVDVTDQTFPREVISHRGGVLVDCWAPWCAPCRMVGPVLEQLAREYAGCIKIAKLNVDENPATASRYGIRSIPTMLLFNNGDQVNRLVGVLPKEEIERHLKALL